MSEWSIEHAWKSDFFTHAQQHPPTRFPSTTSRNNDVHRSVPVNAGVGPGFRGICDTVLTQTLFDLGEDTPTHTASYTASMRRNAITNAAEERGSQELERFA